MFICHSRRLIFVHAPKTAGSATVQVLESMAAPDDVSIGDSPRAQAMGPPDGPLQGLNKHSMLRELVQRFPPGALEGYQVVMTVRNPWDRLVSFHTWARAQTFRHPQILLAKKLEFSPFLHHPLIVRAFSSCPYARYVAGHQGPPPLFLRVETLCQDLSDLAHRLDVALPSPERVNASNRSIDWRTYYTPDDAAQLGRICARDIAQFGYRFEL